MRFLQININHCEAAQSLDSQTVLRNHMRAIQESTGQRVVIIQREQFRDVGFFSNRNIEKAHNNIKGILGI